MDILISGLEAPENIKTDAKLERDKETPQWFAPKQEIDSLKTKPAKQNADIIRDALGLAHYKANLHLLQVSIKQNHLQELITKGTIRFAAPNFIDAKSHAYFRTYAHCPKHWGRTKHLSDPSHQGIKEAISSPVPISPESVGDIEYLGITSIVPDTSDANIQRHADSLLPEIVNVVVASTVKSHIWFVFLIISPLVSFFCLDLVWIKVDCLDFCQLRELPLQRCGCLARAAS